MVRKKANISLKEYNSFGVDTTADLLVEWESVADLVEWLRTEGDTILSNRWSILGGGCNTLFTAPYNGTLIHSVAKGISIVSDTPEEVVIRVEAGHLWDDVVAWSCERGLWGIENLSAIPSSVGASAVQNIGAYGVEAKDCIQSVEVLFVNTLEVRTIAGCDCEFGYRHSIFKTSLAGKVIITAVNYRLSHTPAPKLGYGSIQEEVAKLGELTPQAIRTAITTIRNGKLPDPTTMGNAGSFFTNPILPREQVKTLKELYPTMPTYEVEGRPECLKIATGWLIDQLGWKGRSLGRAGVHAKQALVLVNLGGATGEEIVALAKRICAEVKDKFGVEISPEVNIL